MKSKLETRAKLYLESEPAKISTETQTELSDWLMGEFRQLPLNLLLRHSTAALLNSAHSSIDYRDLNNNK
jgi:hypothetical protein